jgi:hypothetical protein
LSPLEFGASAFGSPLTKRECDILVGEEKIAIYHNEEVQYLYYIGWLKK